MKSKNLISIAISLINFFYKLIVIKKILKIFIFFFETFYSFSLKINKIILACYDFSSQFYITRSNLARLDAIYIFELYNIYFSL